MMIASVDTYKIHFRFTVFCKNEFFTKFSQFCKKFIFTNYCSCGLGACLQWFFSGIMLTPILYVSTDLLSPHPDSIRYVFPSLDFVSTVKGDILPILGFRLLVGVYPGRTTPKMKVHVHPLILLCFLKSSPSLTLYFASSNIWILSPCILKSIRVPKFDQTVRRRFSGHMAYPRSITVPKSIAVCTSVYYCWLGFSAIQNHRVVDTKSSP